MQVNGWKCNDKRMKIGKCSLSVNFSDMKTKSVLLKVRSHTSHVYKINMNQFQCKEFIIMLTDILDLVKERERARRNGSYYKHKEENYV